MKETKIGKDLIKERLAQSTNAFKQAVQKKQEFDAEKKKNTFVPPVIKSSIKSMNSNKGRKTNPLDSSQSIDSKQIKPKA